MTKTGTQPPRLLRSAAAVLAGFVVIVGLSLGTRKVLRLLGVDPLWGELYDTSLNILALAYRCIYAVVGGYIAAKFAPRNPMRHALALGVVVSVLWVPVAIFRFNTYDTGPAWYPVALALTSVPCAWLGGVLRRSSIGPRIDT